MDDLISRAEAIRIASGYCHWTNIPKELAKLPSAEPEIIRCKDCKYQDENWRRVSVRWLLCMDVRTGSNWYCGSAERRTDDERRGS